MNSGDAADLGAATNETEHTSVLAELTHDLAFMLTPDGRVASVNQAFEQTIGYSRDEACSLPVDQFVAPDCAASLRQLLEQTSASAGPTTLDLAFQTRDGRRILAELRCRNVREGHRNAGLHAVAQDITQLVRAEQEIYASQARFRALSNATGQGVVTTGADGEALSANRTFLAMTGLTVDQVAGSGWLSVFHPEEQGGFRQAWQDTVASQAPYTGNHRVVRASGEACWARLHAEPALDGVELLGYVVTLSELAAAPVAQDCLAATQGVRPTTGFVDKMSHELRTPLHGIVGMTDLLLAAELSGEQREQALTVRESGQVLLRIIDDVVDFCHAEAGTLKLEAADFDLHEAVEETLELLAARADTQSIETICRIGADVPPWVIGDAARLRQTLGDLLAAAILVTSQGEIGVEVSPTNATASLADLTFSVTNSDNHLSDDTIAQLFEPFARVEGSTGRKHGASGLGLAVARRLAGLMGGTVGVENRVGRGVRFWLTARFDRNPARVSEPPPSPAAMAGKRALIVDASPAARAALREACSVCGILAEETNDVRVAVAKLREARDRGAPYHVVLFDSRLAAPDVFDDVTTPVVAIVPFSQLGSRDFGPQNRYQGRLAKPVRVSQFRRLMGRLFDADSLSRATIVEGAAERVRNAAIERHPILIVEDNPLNQKVATSLVEKLGFRAELAMNGVEALDALSRPIRYSLILMDCLMPQMDGFEATAEIRQREYAGRRTPIVAMTAGVSGDREKCLDAGMDDYIVKPVTLEELAAVIERWVV